MTHVFGDCELDESRAQLRRRGETVRLEPGVYELLAYLLKNRERLVPKDELMKAVWAGQNVNESVLPKCIAAARQAVGDDRFRPRVIEAVHGRGYRFLAPVESRGGGTDAEGGPAPLPPSAVAPLIGREAVIARLRKGLDAAAGGRGSVALLAGAAGAGKTRTAHELALEAHKRRFLILVARVHDGDCTPPFWPWTQALRTCVRALDAAALTTDAGAGAPEVATLVPELRERLPHMPPARAVEGPRARFRLYESVAGFLSRVARRQPLALIFDDLHLADQSSLRLLTFLAGEIRSSRVFVLGTYRDAAVRRGHPLGPTIAALARQSDAERISLRGLDLAATRALIEAIAGTPPGRELVSSLHELSDGNPFLLHELVRAHQDASRCARPGDPAPGLLDLPQGARDAIGRRLDRLSDECARLLHAAAVFGREFSTSLLASAAAVEADRARELLGEALAAQLLEEVRDTPGRFRFRHPLVRQTLYEELNALDRARWHGRAGEAIEAGVGAGSGSHLDEIAHHFFQASPAGNAARAVAACSRAAERAVALLACEEAALHYERALQALELQTPRDEAKRCELLLALGEARLAGGDGRRARADFAAAADLARGLARIDLLARAALGYRDPAEMGAPEESEDAPLLDEALQAVGEAEPALRARLLSRLAATPARAACMESRQQISTEALRLARCDEDSRALRDALSARLWACLGPDHVQERLAVSGELTELSERLGDTHMALLGLEGQLGAHLLAGDSRAADRALESCLRLAGQLREPACLFRVALSRSGRAAARGEYAEAERTLRAAFERGRRTVPMAHFLFAGQMHSLRFLRGEPDDPELQRVLFGDIGSLPPAFEFAVRSNLAFASLLRGRREAACREIELLAERGLPTLPRDEHWLPAMNALAGSAVLLHDRRRAAELYELLGAYSRLVFVDELFRSTGTTVASALGNLATVLGEYDRAAGHYEQAIEAETAMGAVTAALDSKCGYARLLLLRDGPRDRARAKTLLGEVMAAMAVRGIRRLWQMSILENMGLLEPGGG